MLHLQADVAEGIPDIPWHGDHVDSAVYPKPIQDESVDIYRISNTWYTSFLDHKYDPTLAQPSDSDISLIWRYTS